MTFSDLNLNRFLLDALEEMGFTTPTPIQEKAFSVIMSSKMLLELLKQELVKLLPIY